VHGRRDGVYALRFFALKWTDPSGGRRAPSCPSRVSRVVSALSAARPLHPNCWHV